MTLLEMLPSLRRAATPRIDRAIWPLTTSVDEVGRLCVGDVPLTEVADEYRTPTYVLDEADFRYRMRRYRAALPGVDVVYAGKSLLTVAVARWVADEGLGLDVCSGGELATALAGGVDPARIIMHGNVKTPDELRDAATVEVGRIVADSPIEIAFLSGRVRRRQQVLVRVTPDIDIRGHRRGEHRGDRSEVRLRVGRRACRPGGAARAGSAVAGIWSDCIATSARKSPMPRSTARPSGG